MAEDGWGLTQQACLRIRMLEWLHDAGQTDPGRTVSTSDFESDNPDRAAIKRVARQLMHDGHALPIPQRMAGGPDLAISDEGAALVGWYRQQRANPVERERNCERAFIAWLYEQRSKGFDHAVATDFLQDWRATFWGLPFTEDDVHRATRYLRDRIFIKGTAAAGFGVIRPSLTAAGVQYAREGREPSGGSGGTSYTANFHGDVSGMVGLGEHVEQTQHQGIDAASLATILRAMRDALGDLDDDDRDDVELQIGALEAEASKQDPDAEAVQKRVGRLRKIANRIGDPALTTTVTVATTQLLQALGIG